MLLYDHPISSNALKVRFLLAELGQAYDRREVPLARPRPDWYVAVNPVAGIPTLDDDGFVLSESNTILRYLATRAGATWIYPTDLPARAAVNEFLDRWSLTFRPAFFRHERAALGYVDNVGFDEAARDPARAREIAGEIAPTLALLDRLVTPRGCLLDTVTIADCAAAPVLYRTLNSGLDLDPYPNVRGLRDALVARPAFQAAGPVL
jgi:glutathione S-transferase